MHAEGDEEGENPGHQEEEEAGGSPLPLVTFFCEDLLRSPA